MHRIDTSTALSGGHFTDGNPSLGIPATRLNAAWFESVQEELAAVVESGGGVLNPELNNQLLTGIQSMITSAISAISGSRKQPVGTIRFSACSTPEVGEIACMGQSISRTAYSELFSKIGTTFGAGDGVTTFGLPDGRGRTFVGAGSGPSLTPRSAGQMFGEEEHTLTESEMPEHRHKYYRETFTATNVSLDDTNIEYRNGTLWSDSDPAGDDQPHNNMQPSSVCYVFITCV